MVPCSKKKGKGNAAPASFPTCECEGVWALMIRPAARLRQLKACTSLQHRRGRQDKHKHRFIYARIEGMYSELAEANRDTQRSKRINDAILVYDMRRGEWEDGEERSVQQVQYNEVYDTRTNLRNKGLISADRRTSLLSCLQYPVPYLSRLQRIYLSQCFTCDDV